LVPTPDDNVSEDSWCDSRSSMLLVEAFHQQTGRPPDFRTLPHPSPTNRQAPTHPPTHLQHRPTEGLHPLRLRCSSELAQRPSQLPKVLPTRLALGQGAEGSCQQLLEEEGVQGVPGMHQGP
jgi:hypothetical protein